MLENPLKAFETLDPEFMYIFAIILTRGVI
jgi:hypothetical protein